MGRRVLLAAVFALLLLTVLPVGRALFSAFVVDDAPGRPTEFTLDHVAEVFAPGSAADEVPSEAAPAARSGWSRFRMLGNSAAIGALAALLAVLVGVPMAVLVARTDLPFRRTLGLICYAPLVLPPLLVALAWNMIPALEPPPITSAPEPGALAGVIGIVRAAALFALCYYPIVVLFARRALSEVPGAVEESARLTLGRGRALRRVTLPLVWPGVVAGALFVFLFALNDFAVVDFLNWVRPTGARVAVYPFESFSAWNKSNGQGPATALGLPLLVLGLATLFAVHRLIGRRSRASVGGAHRPAARMRLGVARWPAFAAAVALIGVSAVAPVATLVWRAGGGDAYRRVWQLVAGATSSTDEVAWTLWFAAAAAALALPLAFVLAHRAARSGSTWLPALALLPLALPPIFLGAGYLRLLNHPALSELVGGRNPFLDPDTPRYGPILLLVAKYLPFAIAALWAAFLEIDPRLEEAARTAGVRPLARVLGVLEPLVRPASALAFVLVFVFALREIDTIVLLTGETVMRKIYSMVHFSRDEQVAALSVILIAMQAIPFVVLAILTSGRSNVAAEARTH